MVNSFFIKTVFVSPKPKIGFLGGKNESKGAIGRILGGKSLSKGAIDRILGKEIKYHQNVFIIL